MRARLYTPHPHTRTTQTQARARAPLYTHTHTHTHTLYWLIGVKDNVAHLTEIVLVETKSAVRLKKNDLSLLPPAAQFPPPPFFLFFFPPLLLTEARFVITPSAEVVTNLARAKREARNSRDFSALQQRHAITQFTKHRTLHGTKRRGIELSSLSSVPVVYLPGSVDADTTYPKLIISSLSTAIFLSWSFRGLSPTMVRFVYV